MKLTKAIYPFIGILLSTSIGNAQDNSNITFELPLTENSRANGNVASIEVISNLADSAFIGVLPSVFPNVRTNVVVPAGVENWLQDYANKQFGNTFQASGKQLVWVINKLRVGKDSSENGESSFVKLGADIYSASGGNDYQIQGKFDTLILAAEADLDFGKSIAVALNALYNRSMPSTKTITLNHLSNQAVTDLSKQTLSKTDLLESLQRSNNFKILGDSIYQTGVFLNFQEFLNDVPSITNFYTSVDTSTLQVQLFKIMEDSSAALIQDAWGICINNELYRYKNGQLYAIEKDGNSFTLSKYLDFRNRKNQAIFWRRYIGELQGDPNPFNDAHVYRIETKLDPAIKIEATHLDMATGDITSF